MMKTGFEDSHQDERTTNQSTHPPVSHRSGRKDADGGDMFVTSNDTTRLYYIFLIHEPGARWGKRAGLGWAELSCNVHMMLKILHIDDDIDQSINSSIHLLHDGDSRYIIGA